MQVIRNIKNVPKIKNAILTNGTFDGTHAGHVKILDQLIQKAKTCNGKSVVLTYWPHPRIVLGKADSNFKLLFTLEERIELLSQFDIDYLIILPFTKAFSQMTSKQFIEDILVEKIGVKTLVIGYNHRFGRNREGSFDYLAKHYKNFGFDLEEIPKQLIEEEAVSSTKIRKYLSEGNIKLANKFLQKEFFINGTVIKGKNIGKTLGFPTANIHVDNKHKIIPANGVYIVKIEVQKKVYWGMLNIGFRPTIEASEKLSIEAHILDFDQTIYGESIKVLFVHRIRDEKKFSSLENLKNQLKSDFQKVLEYSTKVN